MKKSHGVRSGLVTLLVPLAVVTLVAAYGCGEDAEVGSSGAPTVVPTTSSSSPPVGSDASAEGGDAAPDAKADGGTKSDGGGVSCGSATCSVGDYCCVKGAARTCESLVEGCTGQGAVRLRCAETSACPGKKCCLERAVVGVSEATCKNDCAPLDVRLCAVDAECAGSKCEEITCGGETYRACNRPVGCN